MYNEDVLAQNFKLVFLPRNEASMGAEFREKKLPIKILRQNPHYTCVSLCFDSRCLLSTAKPPKSSSTIRNSL